MNYTAIRVSPPSSTPYARLEFQLAADHWLHGALLVVALALLSSALSLGSLAFWQRALLALALLICAASGAARLLPGAHPAAVSRLAFDAPVGAAATNLRLWLRDGVERRATLCSGSLLLPGVALLICRFDRHASLLGPGQRLPRRVCAVLRAANHPPGDWRLLQWRLRWPPHPR